MTIRREQGIPPTPRDMRGCRVVEGNGSLVALVRGGQYIGIHRTPQSPTAEGPTGAAYGDTAKDPTTSS